MGGKKQQTEMIWNRAKFVCKLVASILIAYVCYVAHSSWLWLHWMLAQQIN